MNYWRLLKKKKLFTSFKNLQFSAPLIFPKKKKLAFERKKSQSKQGTKRA
jgi:hypothetical protein